MNADGSAGVSVDAAGRCHGAGADRRSPGGCWSAGLFLPLVIGVLLLVLAIRRPRAARGHSRRQARPAPHRTAPPSAWPTARRVRRRAPTAARDVRRTRHRIVGRSRLTVR